MNLNTHRELFFEGIRCAPTSAPAMSLWGEGLLLTLLAGGGIYLVRRRVMR